MYKRQIAYLRQVARNDAAAPAPVLPGAPEELKHLKREAQFYKLPDLAAAAAAALEAASAAPTAASSPTAPGSAAATNGTITAAAASTMHDDTTDIWNKASRMQLEFQSVYVTISSPEGLLFTEAERTAAMAEVNERTSALQGSGFRVKAMNSGVAQDRKTKDYCICLLYTSPSPRD